MDPSSSWSKLEAHGADDAHGSARQTAKVATSNTETSIFFMGSLRSKNFLQVSDPRGSLACQSTLANLKKDTQRCRDIASMTLLEDSSCIAESVGSFDIGCK